MEIQYKNIYKLEEAYNEMSLILTPDICNLIDLDASGSLKHDLTELQIEDLSKTDDTIGALFSDEFIDMNLFPEIDLNVANIENDGHLRRYLTFIRNKVQTVYELSSSLTDFESYEDKYWGDVFNNGKANIHFLNMERMRPNDPVTSLRMTYLRIIEQILTVRDHIDEQLNPGSNVMSLVPNRPVHIRDAHKEWRLVIPDPNRRVAYDKWTSIMKEVRHVINVNSENIAKINATNYMVGGGNTEFDDLINWGSDLTNSVVPDRIISHEIMNEVDVNLLELKTQREKDLYLTKVKNEIQACVSMFKGYMKTHPDYKSREDEITFDEEKSELVYTEVQKEVLVDNWHMMFKEKNKYSLQMFYIHLLVLIEVLERIILYIETKISPQQQLRIEYEVTANTHKLILFHKMGLFEPLYTKHRAHIGVVRFAKLIGTLLGIPEDKHESFRKSLDDFITETFLKPGNKKTVSTPAAERKVDAYLTEIGLINAE